MDLKLEVLVVPVTDVDRAKLFYQKLGSRVDVDYAENEEYRIIQLTPPGSAASIIIGKGITSAQRSHKASKWEKSSTMPTGDWEPVFTPIPPSAPRARTRNTETGLHHGAFEAAAPPHDWWDWYAAYIDARERGSSAEEASAAAGVYMAEAKHVVVPPA